MSLIGVIDFETTGLSPAMGDRATEVAIVLLEGTQVVDRFQSLMNAGVRIPAFIEQYTGISNEMIRTAPPAADGPKRQQICGTRPVRLVQGKMEGASARAAAPAGVFCVDPRPVTAPFPGARPRTPCPRCCEHPP